MKKTKAMYIYLKWFVALTVSIKLGTMMMRLADGFIANVWMPRILGAIIAAIVGQLFYMVWIQKKDA